MRKRTHTHSLTHTHAHAHTHTHARTHAHTHTYAHAHIHTHTRTHIHTRTQAYVLSTPYTPKWGGVLQLRCIPKLRCEKVVSVKCVCESECTHKKSSLYSRKRCIRLAGRQRSQNRDKFLKKVQLNAILTLRKKERNFDVEIFIAMFLFKTDLLLSYCVLYISQCTVG